MRFIFPEPWNFIYFWKQLLYSFMFPPEFHWTDTCWCKKSVEVGSLSHYLQGLGYARLCKISSITSMSNFTFGSSTESAVRFQPIGESVENAIRWLSLSPLGQQKNSSDSKIYDPPFGTRKHIPPFTGKPENHRLKSAGFKGDMWSFPGGSNFWPRHIFGHKFYILILLMENSR